MKFFLLTALALLLVSPHLVLAQTPVENDLNGTIVGSPSPAAATPTTPSPAPTSAVTANGNFVPLAPVPGLTTGITADTGGTANFLNNLYKYLIGIAAILAVVEIIWGGLEIATKDSVSKKSDGKKRIWQALMGLALVLSPALVFGIINPAILNMSISMAPLNVQNTPGYTSPTAPTLPGAPAYTLEGTTAVAGLPTGQIGSVTINRPPSTASAGDPEFDAYIKQKQDYVAQCTNATTGGTYQETAISGGTQLRMDCTIPLSKSGTSPQQQSGGSVTATAPTADQILNPKVFTTASAVSPGSSCTTTSDNVYYCWPSSTICAAALAPNSALQQAMAAKHYSLNPCAQY